MASAESVVLTALTHLMGRWTSAAAQARVAAEADVTIDTADIPPLYVLGREGAMRAGDLARALHLTRPTMSKQLRRLERTGLITQTTDPTDGRATIIHLSPAGTTAHARLVDRGRTMMREAMTGWTAQEIEMFTTHLTRFTEALATRADETTTERTPARGDARLDNESQNGEIP